MAMVGGMAQRIGVDAEQFYVFAQAREQRLRLAFQLDAQRVDHVGLLQRVLEACSHAHAHGGEVARHQRGRTAQGHLRAQFVQRVDVAAGDTAVLDIADDGNAQPVQRGVGVAGAAAQVFAHGKRVEQRPGSGARGGRRPR